MYRGDVVVNGYLGSIGGTQKDSIIITLSQTHTRPVAIHTYCLPILYIRQASPTVRSSISWSAVCAPVTQKVRNFFMTPLTLKEMHVPIVQKQNLSQVTHTTTLPSQNHCIYFCVWHKPPPPCARRLTNRLSSVPSSKTRLFFRFESRPQRCDRASCSWQ